MQKCLIQFGRGLGEERGKYNEGFGDGGPGGRGEIGRKYGMIILFRFFLYTMALKTFESNILT
jgi:hypothetical protein